MTCNTCCRPAAAPLRIYNADGSINSGCVDAFHTDHVVTKDAAWHLRPEAKRLRKRLAAFQR